MKRLQILITAVCLMFVALAITPEAMQANCTDGWKFVNNGPCAVKITVNTDGPCLGAQTTFTVRSNQTLRVSEVCCITAVKVEIAGPCFGSDNGWPVRCITGQECALPGPFDSISVGSCGVRIQ